LAVLIVFLLGGLLLVALGMMLLGPEFGGWLDRVLRLRFLAHIWPLVRWTVSGFFIVVAVEIMYFLGPNVKQRYADTLAGAVFAAAIWLALSYALGIYFQRFANLNRTYGVLGGVIALMVWLNWSFFVILLGAEINGEALKASGDVAIPSRRSPPQKMKPKTPADNDSAAA
jgi:membrane protein